MQAVAGARLGRSLATSPLDVKETTFLRSNASDSASGSDEKHVRKSRNRRRARERTKERVDTIAAQAEKLRSLNAAMVSTIRATYGDEEVENVLQRLDAECSIEETVVERELAAALAETEAPKPLAPRWRARTDEERMSRTRERNRKHARAHRLRKKLQLKTLVNSIRGLVKAHSILCDVLGQPPSAIAVSFEAKLTGFEAENEREEPDQSEEFLPLYDFADLSPGLLEAPFCGELAAAANPQGATTRDVLETVDTGVDGYDALTWDSAECVDMLDGLDGVELFTRDDLGFATWPDNFHLDSIWDSRIFAPASACDVPLVVMRRPAALMQPPLCASVSSDLRTGHDADMECRVNTRRVAQRTAGAADAATACHDTDHVAAAS